jgi:hypothetical protein
MRGEPKRVAVGIALIAVGEVMHHPVKWLVLALKVKPVFAKRPAHFSFL